MPAPGNEPVLDLEIAREAAQRWGAEKRSRERKVEARDNGELEKAETRPRIGKRIQYLLGKVRQARAEGDPVPDKLEAMLSVAAVLPEEGDSETLERVIGETRDFLSIEFLEGGIVASRSVGRIVTNLGNGRLAFGTVIGLGPVTGLAAAAVMALTAFVATPLLAGLSFFLLGAGPILWVISTTTLRQSVTPPRLLGRVSAINILSYGARPLGSGLGAIVGGLFGADLRPRDQRRAIFPGRLLRRRGHERERDPVEQHGKQHGACVHRLQRCRRR